MDKSTKILVVEDDRIRFQIQDFLFINGYKSDYAEDMVSAKEKIRTLEYPLILLDMYIPYEKPGEPSPKWSTELIHHINILNERILGQQIQIIMLSAVVDDPDLRESFGEFANIRAFIDKSDYEEKLLQEIQIALRNPLNVKYKITYKNISEDLIERFKTIALEKFELFEESRNAFEEKNYGEVALNLRSLLINITYELLSLYAPDALKKGTLDFLNTKIYRDKVELIQKKAQSTIPMSPYLALNFINLHKRLSCIIHGRDDTHPEKPPFGEPDLYDITICYEILKPILEYYFKARSKILNKKISLLKQKWGH